MLLKLPGSPLLSQTSWYRSLDSTCKCTDWVNAKTYLIRGFEPKTFSWTIIEFIHHQLNFFRGDRRERPVLGKVLANEPIGIFIESAFPGGIRVRKEVAHVKRLRNGLVLREFFPIIRGHGMEGEAKGP